MTRSRTLSHSTTPKTYTKSWTSTIIYKLRQDWSLKEDVVCEDKVLMDLKAKKDKVYPYQPYPMHFPLKRFRCPTLPMQNRMFPGGVARCWREPLCARAWTEPRGLPKMIRSLFQKSTPVSILVATAVLHGKP